MFKNKRPHLIFAGSSMVSAMARSEEILLLLRPQSFSLQQERRGAKQQRAALNFTLHSPVVSSVENLLFKLQIEVNFTEVNTDAPLHGEVLLEAHPGANGKVDVIIALLREVISVKQTHQRNQQLRSFWERIIRRLETVSLCSYISLIAINFTVLIVFPQVWG
ncbi:hypothetical protein ANCCAN_19125 [Ancylostoma caninum]|uniref:Uncharacterized protein n=1 Tax=Ancylostoma caninum TaxID=29170 RepID=A0A368FXL4_ANCCA|nr:hypothetical protein ANCCAN_19125 [Ancylostoma caninum]